MTSFLDLPPEVREMIYGYGLPHPQPPGPYNCPYYHISTTGGLIFQPQQQGYSSLRGQPPPPALGLLSTSKAIRQECLPVLFRTNTWHLPKSIHVDLHTSLVYKYGQFIRSAILDFDGGHPVPPVRRIIPTQQRLVLTRDTFGLTSHICPSQQSSSATPDNPTMSGSETIPEATLKDMMLEMMPKLQTLTISIIPMAGPERVKALRECFQDKMKVTVSKEVDVLVKQLNGSIPHFSKEEAAILKA